jgi:hypothetical protein
MFLLCSCCSSLSSFGEKVSHYFHYGRSFGDAAAAAAAEEKAEAHPDSLLNHPTGQKAKGSSYDSEW